MLGAKKACVLASCCMPRLQQCQETFCFDRFMGIRSVGIHFSHFLRQPVSMLVAATNDAKRFQSTSTMNTEGDSASFASSSSSSASSFASPMQQLYKSSHRGRGDVAMPKPYSPKTPKVSTAAAGGLLPSRSACTSDAGPVPERQLTPLQKRQLLFKDKAAFVLTPQALRRLKYLIAQYNPNLTNNNNRNPQQSNGKSSKSGGCSNLPSLRTKVTDGGSAQSVLKPAGIRIGVRRRGCSGYSYTVNYYFPEAEEETKRKEMEKKNSDTLTGLTGKQQVARGGLGDVTVEQDGVKVVVDGNALFYVLGTEMDYVVRNVEEKFTFKNPNQKHSCGCEESFMPFGEGDDDDD